MKAKKSKFNSRPADDRQEQQRARRSSNVTNIEPFLKEVPRKKTVNIVPRNIAQEDYLDLLYDARKAIVIATGPAGTGKSMLAMIAAIKALQEGKAEKIIMTRPAVSVEDEKHGFLPGDLNAKLEPWTKPLFDVMHEYYSPKETAFMLEQGILEIAPLAMMRGRTFKNAYIVLDEAQNCTPNQMKMALTRIGDNSRIFVTGDIAQTDRKVGDNGLHNFQQLVRRFQGSKYVSLIEFGIQDVERHPAVAEVLRIYGDDE